MKTDEKTVRFGRVFLCALALFAMAGLLLTSRETARVAEKAILLCGKTLIPTLFPFMALSGLLMKLGFAEWLGKRIGRPFRALFGVSDCCVAAVLTGLLCGFPTGAVAAASLYRRGLCGEEDYRRTLLLSSFAAPGFVIAGVGGGLLGSTRRGLLLFLLQLSASLAVGLLFSLFKRNEAAGAYLTPTGGERSPLICLSQAIREAVDGIVGVCGSVIFFSVFSGLVSSLPFLPQALRCLLASFFELTSGMALSASTLPPDAAFLLSAAAIGWAGVSVHAQTALAAEGGKLPASYLLGKALTSLLSALFALLSLKIGLI